MADNIQLNCIRIRDINFSISLLLFPKPFKTENNNDCLSVQACAYNAVYSVGVWNSAAPSGFRPRLGSYIPRYVWTTMYL